ncbi:type III-A CRISPR-associated RAMP protein Csm4 [Olsenella sp. An290]|uniref:type III-A CRISPR-associated RAMP protein Csm4 n=1 Tax=Olsenella sp. An290 TaxID=1965625 RepID=UPI000B39A419|nr:type III-A CRISPR-associated RAMP protein Csm4 [Olsenella sp. An290]OUO35074.1 type III-A CRISPR-associated RAMP protein Csm4 [Olsenella sp. An290]
MPANTIIFRFNGPVHFGAGRLSDGGHGFDAGTLFSALYLEALRAGCADELLEAARTGSFSISDAFPYIGGTFYLPRPILASELSEEEDEPPLARNTRRRKAMKKLEYLSCEHYGAYLSGELDPVKELEGFDLGVGAVRTRVNLERRESGDAEPYHVGSFSFRPGTGLYVLHEGDYDIRPLLDQLSYAGIGGKRTSGYGRFEYAIEPIDPREQIAARSGRSVLLSTAIPRDDELTDELLTGARYRLVRKGGFVQSASHSASPQKKRDVYAFAPGSVFERRFEGDIVDVNATPGAHPVYRYARTSWLEA